MQKRAISGKVFEEEIAKKYGKRVSKSPKIVWNGSGRTNLDKIISLNYDENMFFPTDNSVYSKYDLIDHNGGLHEIKKYLKNQVTDVWKLYSEPIIKVSTKSSLESIVKKFGNGDLSVAREKYNGFIGRLFIELQKNGTLERMKNDMTKNTLGMYVIDGYINMNEIEFRWRIVESAWMGFNRITLEFKLK